MARHVQARRRHAAPVERRRGRRPSSVVLTTIALAAAGLAVPAAFAATQPSPDLVPRAAASSTRAADAEHRPQDRSLTTTSAAGSAGTTTTATETGSARATTSATSAAPHSRTTATSSARASRAATAPVSTPQTASATASTATVPAETTPSASAEARPRTSPRRTAAAATTAAPALGGLPRPDHVVIVVEENHSYAELAGLPYTSSLLGDSATLTQSYAITHPSQPNYLALWSGSTQGVTDSSCPHDLGSTPSLGSQLISAGLSVRGYFQGMPSAGFTGCRSGAYVRRHNPLADFSATADAAHMVPFSAFPSDFDRLPDVSFVVPDLDHDMHDGSVQAGDRWLRDNLGEYATWAKSHNSLLIVTADEDDSSAGNHILTVISGEHVQAGVRSSQRIDHYGLLHTIEDAYSLPHLGSPAPGLTDIWR